MWLRINQNRLKINLTIPTAFELSRKNWQDENGQEPKYLTNNDLCDKKFLFAKVKINKTPFHFSRKKG